MTDASQISKLSNIKKLAISILTPSFIIIVIATFFIWVFLYRLGRQDIFLQVIGFKEIFYFISFYSVLSVLTFCLVFFIPSITPTFIFHTEIKNFSDFKIIKTGYIKVLIIGSLIAAAIFYIIPYYFESLHTVKNSWLALIFFLSNAIICVFLNFLFNGRVASRRSSILDGSDWWKFVLIINVIKPGLLGLWSCSFVFPLGLLIKNLKFPAGTGNLTELFSLYALTSFIILFTLLPLMVFVGLKSNIANRIIAFISATLLSLFLISCFLQVIPVMILNMTMKLTGVMDLTTYHYAVPIEKYPAEMFQAKEWDLAESIDKKFHIFEGVNLFSMGNISLICPKDIPGVLKESMNYQLADKKYDEKLREKLQLSAKKCNVLDRETLIKWQ